MEPGAFVGLGLATMSGVIDGTTTVPMQFARRWRWENIWLLYSFFGMICGPWIVLFFFLPNPWRFYAQIPGQALVAPACFGAGWGLGSILFGLGVTRVGMGLAIAIVISLTALNGVLIPLLVLHPEKVGTLQGKILLAALGVLIVGVTLCSIAAARRTTERPLLLREKPALVAGLICCVLSGIFSPMMNLVFAFGTSVTEAAVSLNAGDVGASVALLTIAMFPAFLANAGYCIYLLNRNRSWRDFVLPDVASHWLYGFLMGVLQMSAFLVYGIAVIYMGSVGPIVGWPVYMATLILTGNAWGWIRGEWEGSDRRTYSYLVLGILGILAAIVLVGVAESYSV